MTIKTLTASIAGALLLVGCGGSQTDSPPTDTNTGATPATASSGSGEIRIVGSSTVYPFSTKVAQEFKNKTGQNVVVESTGSGGGHKLFCAGVGPEHPDITNSSRRQKESEFDMCAANGVTDIVEVQIGFDGIVIANALGAEPVDLSLKQIYLAFAQNVPVSDTDCTLQANPYDNWSEIDASLPDAKIEAYGPPPTSGTRDAFVEIAMEGGAKQVACLADLKDSDEDAFEVAAHTLREDGNWIDAGENDNAIVQTLVNTPTAVGVFGYSFLDQNADKIKGSTVDGAEPTFEKIAAGDYPVSRSLYFYVKKAHVGVKDGLQDFALEFTSDEAAAPGGYLEEIGLVPLPDEERAAVRSAVEKLETYSY